MTTVANQPTIWNTSTNTQRKTSAGISLVLAGFLGWAAAPAAAQTPANNLFEWECPLGGQQVPNADPFPGALLAEDARRTWFVTRVGVADLGPVRLVRVTLPSNLDTAPAPQTTSATCNWWEFEATDAFLRFKLGGGYAFVRTETNLHRITVGAPPNYRRIYQDNLFGFSDRRADRRRHNCRTASGLFDGHGGHRPLAPGTDADQR